MASHSRSRFASFDASSSFSFCISRILVWMFFISFSFANLPSGDFCLYLQKTFMHSMLFMKELLDYRFKEQHQPSAYIMKHRTKVLAKTRPSSLNVAYVPWNLYVNNLVRPPWSNGASWPSGHYWDYYPGARGFKLNHCNLQLIWRSGTRRFHLLVPDLHMSCSDLTRMRGYQNSSHNGHQATSFIRQISAQYRKLNIVQLSVLLFDNFLDV